ncbi:MAG TPA: hypothetical protein VHS96_14745 [Bacteroidia bacterium]|nr:hypothetical protein [Bacteroidia bacterium]
MENLLKLTLSVLLLLGFAHAQRTDPASTPPGAPLMHFDQGDVSSRLIPNHPGNAGQRVAVSNFTIIESQSGNAGHTMDLNWRTVLLGMGHNVTILPQTALDNTSFFGTTDVLIVSSGTITLPPGRVTTIRQFMQTGKSVYIQGEYLTSYTSNGAFATIANATGGTFALGTTIAGDLVPTTILNAYATTPNSVSSIGYHWYGATGSGCNNIEYFMRYSGNNIGYVYCPTNSGWGDVIQNTDQDWVRSMTSPPLMQNIIFALISGNACSVVCGTVLEAQHMDLQATRRQDGSVDLQWTLDGDPQSGSFQVESNGRIIGNLAVGQDDGMVFQFTDLRIPSGIQHYRVRLRDANGNETLSGETTLDLGAAPTKLRVATEAEGFRLWLTEGTDLEALWLVDASGKQITLSTGGLHEAAGELVAMQGIAPGIYFFKAIARSGEMLAVKAIWMP